MKATKYLRYVGGKTMRGRTQERTVLGATQVGHSVTSQDQNGWRTNRETSDLGEVMRMRGSSKDEMSRGRTCQHPCKSTF